MPISQSTGDVDDVFESGGFLDMTQVTEISVRRPANNSRRQSPTANANAGWESDLSTSERGDYCASASNVDLILRHHPDWRGKLRYDVRAEIVVLGDESGSPISDKSCEYRDIHDTKIAIWLERSKYAIQISPSSPVLTGVVNSIADASSFDPVRDYLEGLAWDGVHRLDRFLPDYFGAPDTALNRAYGRLWSVSAVARTFEPGCQADHMLVLCGPQGKLKSTALRTMAKEADWFVDRMPDLSNVKASGEVLLGRWIVEQAELESLGKAELSSVKAFLTSREDKYRAAYARRSKTQPRRCVFAGSTNDETFLRDPSGARRFWPVSVGRIDIEAIKRDRDQLWAEAVSAFRAGEKWHIEDAGLAKAALQSQDERYQEDPWEAPITDYIDQKERLEDRTRFTTQELLQDAVMLEKGRWGSGDARRVVGCLRRLGFSLKQRRDEGGRSRAYERAEASNGKG